jgi:hypothetical protein
VPRQRLPASYANQPLILQDCGRPDTISRAEATQLRWLSGWQLKQNPKSWHGFTGRWRQRISDSGPRSRWTLRSGPQDHNSHRHNCHLKDWDGTPGFSKIFQRPSKTSLPSVGWVLFWSDRHHNWLYEPCPHAGKGMLQRFNSANFWKWSSPGSRAGGSRGGVSWRTDEGEKWFNARQL